MAKKAFERAVILTSDFGKSIKGPEGPGASFPLPSSTRDHVVNMICNNMPNKPYLMSEETKGQIKVKANLICHG